MSFKPINHNWRGIELKSLKLSNLLRNPKPFVIVLSQYKGKYTRHDYVLSELYDAK